MKVIFLDIDGVLNTSETFKFRKENFIKTGLWSYKIDLFRVNYLKEIINNTNAKIVLSSTWKINFTKENNTIICKGDDGKELLEIFKQFDLEIYDLTNTLNNNIRQLEIKEWLDEHDVEKFIIIDDETYDLQYYKDYIIKTRKYGVPIGLCENHIELATNMLNGKKLILKNKEI